MSDRPHAPLFALRRVARVGWFGRAEHVTIIGLKVLAVLLALQLSGVAHFAMDVLVHFDCSAECDHERSTDDDRRECPPGCPTCHACAHAQAGYVPRTPRLVVMPILRVPAPELAEDHAPPSRELPSVFRPPRAVRFVQA